MSENLKKMVAQFQCPGCVCGPALECGKFQPETDYGFTCGGHVVGTTVMTAGHIALGMPKGFNRTRRNGNPDPLFGTDNKLKVFFWEEGTSPGWDRLNVPVWAMEEDGYLFVRTYAPRIDKTWIDVVEGGKLSMVPQAINVGEFYDEID